MNLNQEIEKNNLKNIPKLEDVIKYLEKKYMNRSIIKKFERYDYIFFNFPINSNER